MGRGEDSLSLSTARVCQYNRCVCGGGGEEEGRGAKMRPYDTLLNSSHRLQARVFLHLLAILFSPGVWFLYRPDITIVVDWA